MQMVNVIQEARRASKRLPDGFELTISPEPAPGARVWLIGPGGSRVLYESAYINDVFNFLLGMIEANRIHVV